MRSDIRADIRTAAPGAAPVRSIVLWFPDWPVTALAREGAVDPTEAVAVLEHGEVVACSPSARADGVRRGQRRRDAQARCPRLTVVAADQVRDHRVFAPVVACIEERAPGVQLVRPGLCALRARGPARYYGGEREAARVLLGALGEQGLVGVRAGIADGPFTAEQAARVAAAEADRVCVVPTGEAAAFLAPLPIATLVAAEGGATELPGPARPARSADAGGVQRARARPGAGAVRGARHPSARPRRGARCPGHPAAHPAARAAPRGGVRAAARNRRPGRVRHAGGRRRVPHAARSDRPGLHRAARRAGRRPRRAQRAGLAAPGFLRRRSGRRPGAVAARARMPRACAAGWRSCGSRRRRWTRHPITPPRSSVRGRRSGCTTPCRGCRRCSGIAAS